MKPHFTLGTAAALLTMTAVPVWATCHDTSSVREPGQSAQVESNADLDVASRSTDGEHLRAEEVPVENLDEHQATQGDEDPAPEGYTTNVPPELIVDDADVGETTPESTEGEADKRNAELSNRAREGGSETKAMKTSVDEAGEYAEESVEEQAAMANTEENAEKVEEMTENTVLGEGGQIEAATGGAEPTENWFGCNSDADGSEGDACEPSETEAAAPSGGVEEERDYAELETEPAKREVNLEVECLEEPGVDGASKG